MKILVLTCSTGGGHDACAKYIENEFTESKIKCKSVNYLQIIGKKYSKIIEKLYLDSTKGNGKIFEKLYKLGEIYNKSNLKSPIYMLNKKAKDKLYTYILKNNYDLVICTHLFPSMALTEINKKYNIKFINVATDYECIPFWNETNPDAFIIPSDLLIDKFIKKGFKRNILIPLGIPVSSKFLNAKKIKMKDDKKTILITSGSMGFGNLKSLVIKLLSEIKDTYFIVICGNNTKLKKELKSIKNDNLIVLGFVKNMNDYIYSSDIVISKPGGLTTSEVATMRRPLIHMMPIPGVETYNANFFEENGMSLKATNEIEVLNCVKKLLVDKNMCNQIIKNQKKYINQKSAHDLVDYLIKHDKYIN